jgi:hypothetical protein
MSGLSAEKKREKDESKLENAEKKIVSGEKRETTRKGADRSGNLINFEEEQQG